MRRIDIGAIEIALRVVSLIVARRDRSIVRVVDHIDTRYYSVHRIAQHEILLTHSE